MTKLPLCHSLGQRAYRPHFTLFPSQTPRFTARTCLWPGGWPRSGRVGFIGRGLVPVVVCAEGGRTQVDESRVEAVVQCSARVLREIEVGAGVQDTF